MKVYFQRAHKLLINTVILFFGVGSGVIVYRFEPALSIFIFPVCIGPCPSGETLCFNGIECFPVTKACDGETDCSDSSDELFCCK